MKIWRFWSRGIAVLVVFCLTVVSYAPPARALEQVVSEQDSQITVVDAEGRPVAGVVFDVTLDNPRLLVADADIQNRSDERNSMIAAAIQADIACPALRSTALGAGDGAVRFRDSMAALLGDNESLKQAVPVSVEARAIAEANAVAAAPVIAAIDVWSANPSPAAWGAVQKAAKAFDCKPLFSGWDYLDSGANGYDKSTALGWALIGRSPVTTARVVTDAQGHASVAVAEMTKAPSDWSGKEAGFAASLTFTWSLVSTPKCLAGSSVSVKKDFLAVGEMIPKNHHWLTHLVLADSCKPELSKLAPPKLAVTGGSAAVQG